MAIWVALYIAYAGLILAGIEQILVDRRIKKIRKELGSLKKELVRKK